MAEDDIRVKHWFNFFREAGLNSVDSWKYAKTFCHEDMKVKNITVRLEHQDSMHCDRFLQLLGVKLGHTDQIIEEAKKHQTRQGDPQVDFVKLDENAIVSESTNTLVHSKPCGHHAGEKCMNCSFCDKHMNEKSLVKHVRVVHKFETTPTRKRKRKSSAPTSSSSSLRSSPKHIHQEDLSGDSIEAVPPFTIMSTLPFREAVERETVQDSLTRSHPEALQLSHQSGLEMVDVNSNVSVLSSKSATASDGTKKALTGYCEAIAQPQASSAHLSHSSRESPANLQQPGQVNSVHLPQPCLASSVHPPQASHLNIAHCSSPKLFQKECLLDDCMEIVPPVLSRSNLMEVDTSSDQNIGLKNVVGLQPSQARSVNLPQPRRASSSSPTNQNMAASVDLVQSNLASSALLTGNVVTQLNPPDCVKPLFHLAYPNPTLALPAQTPSPGKGQKHTAERAPLPVIGTAWSCSHDQGDAPLLFISGRDRRAACRVRPVSQVQQAATSGHRIRIILVNQGLETIQDII